jgi:hypothetical protein
MGRLNRVLHVYWMRMVKTWRMVTWSCCWGRCTFVGAVLGVVAGVLVGGAVNL